VVIQEKHSRDMMAVLPLQVVVDLYEAAYGDDGQLGNTIRTTQEDAEDVGPTRVVAHPRDEPGLETWTLDCSDFENQPKFETVRGSV
jgi:hypothetical protein